MTITMPETAPLEAVDDGQRQLLRIALRDAMKLHEDVQAACAPCRAALEVGRACPEHQDQEDTFTARRQLWDRLDAAAEIYTGRRPREPYLLSSADTAIVAAALGEAIAYRAAAGKLPADLALIAGYEELLRHLAAG